MLLDSSIQKRAKTNQGCPSLAGLVLIDPLLLPKDARKKATIMGKVKDGTIGRLEDSRYTTSMMDLISMLEGDSASSVSPLINSGNNQLLNGHSTNNSTINSNLLLIFCGSIVGDNLTLTATASRQQLSIDRENCAPAIAGVHIY